MACEAIVWVPTAEDTEERWLKTRKALVLDSSNLVAHLQGRLAFLRKFIVIQDSPRQRLSMAEHQSLRPAVHPLILTSLGAREQGWEEEHHKDRRLASVTLVLASNLEVAVSAYHGEDEIAAVDQRIASMTTICYPSPWKRVASILVLSQVIRADEDEAAQGWFAWAPVAAGPHHRGVNALARCMLGFSMNIIDAQRAIEGYLNFTGVQKQAGQIGHGRGSWSGQCRLDFVS